MKLTPINQFNKITSMLALSGVTLAAASFNAQAADIDVAVTNLTGGTYFTPLLVTAHTSNVQFYTLGAEASDALQAMAEGGDISALKAQADAANAVSAENPAGGLLAPGMTTMATMDTGDNGYLSLAAMILPTNDGFVGLNSWKIPSEPGTYTAYLNAYDAGTEANDEILVPMAGGAPGAAGMPAIPGGMGGTGATGVTTEETNPTVHVHRGNLGDDDMNGGSSDVNNKVHRWLNPVARVVVTVR